MSATAFLRSVAQAFGTALEPLRVALGSEEEFSKLLAENGWEPVDTFDVNQVETLFNGIGADFTSFANLMAQVETADAITAVQLVRDAVDVLKSVITKLQALINTVADPALPFPFNRSDFWQEFPPGLVHYLFAKYLEEHQPGVASPFLAVGVIAKETVPSSGPGRIEYLKSTLHWERIPNLLDPQVLIDEIFYGQTGELLASHLIDTLGLAALVDGIRGVLVRPGDDLLDAYYDAANPARGDVRMALLPFLGGEDNGLPFGLGLTVLPIPRADKTGGPIGVAIGPAVDGLQQEHDLGPVHVRLTGGFQNDKGIQLELRPGSVGVSPTLADGVFAELQVTLGGSEPIVLIGSPDGHRLQAQSFGLGLRAEGTLSGAEVALQFDLDGVRLIFDAAGADDFTQRVVGGDEQQVGFDSGLRWSSRHGLSFRGQVGLKAYAPVAARFGPFAVDTLGLELSTAGGALALAVKATGRAELGPLVVTVQDLGLEFSATPTMDPDPPGNFGVFDVGWDVQPPSGYGLQLDVSSDIRGGGFLARDEATDRWIGALSFQIQRFQLSGLVITERDSLIGLLWFEGMKIPLFGGTIVAVGALLAYRRRSDREAFLGGLKSGALEALMFPDDPIAQAPALVASLVRLFPYDAARTVAGLMARWVFGEASELVVVDLGLLVEFSGSDLQKILVVGRGRAKVKDLSEDMFRLNVELYGEWDLSRGELLVLASLRDSRLLGGELSGDGMLYSGPLAGFILSVGGFNPRYEAPKGLPALRRLSARLVDRDNLKLGIELYFALTTCNLQFGVKAALWAGAGGFSITGLFVLDVLMRFDFSMVVDLEFVVELRRGSRVLASIGFKGVLEGVSPLRLDGKAKIKILFLSVSVPVSLQIGGGGPVSQPEVDVLPGLVDAIGAAENWKGDAAAGVVLAERERDGVWAAPEGALKMSQQVAPMDLLLTRLGPSPLRSPQRFLLGTVSLEGPRTTQAVEADFSLGLYQDLDLNESIQAPVTEKMESGFELAADAVEAGVEVAGGADYEEIVVDAPVDLSVSMMAAGPLPKAATGRRLPRAGMAAEQDFYLADVTPVSLTPPRFLTVDDGLMPSAHDAPTLENGLSYAKARQFRQDATAPGAERIVRRYEAFT